MTIEGGGADSSSPPSVLDALAFAFPLLLGGMIRVAREDDNDEDNDKEDDDNDT